MKIAIIGAGNMGGAIARGMAQGTKVAASDLCVSNRSTGKLNALKAEFPDIRVTTSNKEAATNADVVILAVKPWLIGDVLNEMQLTNRQMVVSAAAGISIYQLAGMIQSRCKTDDNRNETDTADVFRLVPNTAIALRESMTLIAAGNHTPEGHSQWLKEVFDEMGLALLIPEKQIAATTAMTSCGIAYALKYIQAAMQAGIELGVYPKDGMKMVAQSMKGAAELILQNDTHPAVEIDKVCTPGGITIRGINELEHAGFASALIKAIKISAQ